MSTYESNCCRADYTTETWVSKTTRRIRTCKKCGKPCRRIKKLEEHVEYEKKREVSIKIIEVVREWCEEHGLEASPHAEAEIAEEIIRQVIVPLVEK